MFDGATTKKVVVMRRNEREKRTKQEKKYNEIKKVRCQFFFRVVGLER